MFHTRLEVCNTCRTPCVTRSAHQISAFSSEVLTLIARCPPSPPPPRRNCPGLCAAMFRGRPPRKDAPRAPAPQGVSLRRRAPAARVGRPGTVGRKSDVRRPDSERSRNSEELSPSRERKDAFVDSLVWSSSAGVERQPPDGPVAQLGGQGAAARHARRARRDAAPGALAPGRCRHSRLDWKCPRPRERTRSFAAPCPRTCSRRCRSTPRSVALQRACSRRTPPASSDRG